MVYVGKDTPYMKLLAPFLEKKQVSPDSHFDCGRKSEMLMLIIQQLAADCWGVDITPIKGIFQPMLDWLLAAVPSLNERYPKNKRPDVMLGRMVRNMLMSEELCLEYASYFAGKSNEELEALAMSFSFGE